MRARLRQAVIGGYVIQSRHSSARMAPCGWRVQFRLAKGLLSVKLRAHGEAWLVRGCDRAAWNAAGRTGRCLIFL